MSNPLETIAGWVTEAIHSLGYLGVGLIVALENLFPPIPSELVLPLAGFLAGRGRFSLPLVILAATAGSVAGALVLYSLGRWVGEEPLRRFIQRFGRWLLLRESDLDRAVDWFDRHGRAGVFFGRVVPLARSLISVPAGIACMPLWQFALYTAAGSAVWNTVLIGAGWLLGEQWTLVRDYARYLGYAAAAAGVVAVAWFIWRRARDGGRRSHEEKRSRSPGQPEQP
jgi:membrane protein DedA with SNARE-associated domain